MYKRQVHDIEQAIAEIEQIGQNRAKLDFDMDGAVIKVNDFAQRDLMGSTNKFPRWAIAVSYTHLDVYKRQPKNALPPRPALRGQSCRYRPAELSVHP